MPDDLQLIAAAPVLREDGYITVVETAGGTFKLMDISTFNDVHRDFVVEKIKQYEVAIRMSKRLLGFLDEQLPVPSQEESQRSWRYLCLGCLNEGYGLPPHECPRCHERKRFYATGEHGADPRSMRDIYRETILATGVAKKSH